MNSHARILIVTVTKVESKAVLDIFQKATGKAPQPRSIDDRIYHDLGNVKDISVFMVQSEMGAGGLGASQQTVRKGIDALSPSAVIMVGIAFGIDSKKQSMGDILVSKQLLYYEPQRIGTDENGEAQYTPRGGKADASTWLLNMFRSVELYWDESQAKVRFGLILSGEKLVDNVDFRQRLCTLEPEAVGGEMEGAGLYAACQDTKVDWILVKSICDWADGHKELNREVQQKLAAKNAASFVLHALQTRKTIDASRGYWLFSHPDLWNRYVDILIFAKSVHHIFQTLDNQHLAEFIGKLDTISEGKRVGQKLTCCIAWENYVEEYDRLVKELAIIPSKEKTAEAFTALQTIENEAAQQTLSVCRDYCEHITRSLVVYSLSQDAASHLMAGDALLLLANQESITQFARHIFTLQRYARFLVTDADNLLRKMIEILSLED